MDKMDSARPLNDDERIERERSEIVAAMNRAGMPYSVHELILLTLLSDVQKQKSEALRGGEVSTDD